MFYCEEYNTASSLREDSSLTYVQVTLTNSESKKQLDFTLKGAYPIISRLFAEFSFSLSSLQIGYYCPAVDKLVFAIPNPAENSKAINFILEKILERYLYPYVLYEISDELVWCFHRQNNPKKEEIARELAPWLHRIPKVFAPYTNAIIINYIFSEKHELAGLQPLVFTDAYFMEAINFLRSQVVVLREQLKRLEPLSPHHTTVIARMAHIHSLIRKTLTLGQSID